MLDTMAAAQEGIHNVKRLFNGDVGPGIDYTTTSVLTLNRIRELLMEFKPPRRDAPTFGICTPKYQ